MARTGNSVQPVHSQRTCLSLMLEVEGLNRDVPGQEALCAEMDQNAVLRALTVHIALCPQLSQMVQSAMQELH